MTLRILESGGGGGGADDGREEGQDDERGAERQVRFAVGPAREARRRCERRALEEETHDMYIMIQRNEIDKAINNGQTRTF